MSKYRMISYFSLPFFSRRLPVSLFEQKCFRHFHNQALQKQCSVTSISTSKKKIHDFLSFLSFFQLIWKEMTTNWECISSKWLRWYTFNHFFHLSTSFNHTLNSFPQKYTAKLIKKVILPLKSTVYFPILDGNIKFK